ncbi:hypothetical protein F66182_9164 [Fusarium sp. NRRL 66182]|nr:hypothetical protein F66182_9164 [Fusarium sp. NRRL 66182]
MWCSSQRYDRNAAAARKRNSQSCSRIYQDRDHDRHRNSHTHGSHSRWEDRSLSRREEDDVFFRSRRPSRTTSNPPTYGTYILPLGTREKYRTMDPTKCTCNCCPHPASTSHGYNQDFKHRDPDVRASHDLKPMRIRRDQEGRYVINVVDNSKGPKNGDTYPLAFKPWTSCHNILSVLAPDKRLAKVFVHWNDGQTERLIKEIPMEEFLEFAKYLEVREVKKVKRVHWA